MTRGSHNPRQACIWLCLNPHTLVLFSHDERLTQTYVNCCLFSLANCAHTHVASHHPCRTPYPLLYEAEFPHHLRIVVLPSCWAGYAPVLAHREHQLPHTKLPIHPEYHLHANQYCHRHLYRQLSQLQCPTVHLVDCTSWPTLWHSLPPPARGRWAVPSYGFHGTCTRYSNALTLMKGGREILVHEILDSVCTAGIICSCALQLRVMLVFLLVPCLCTKQPCRHV